MSFYRQVDIYSTNYPFFMVQKETSLTIHMPDHLTDTILQRMKTYIPTITEQAALSVFRELHNYQSVSADIEELKILLDHRASKTMTELLHITPFYTHILSGEGQKEIHHTGSAAPSVENGYYGNRHNYPLEGINDPLEGTIFAATKQPGACSIIAVVPKSYVQPFQIRPTPNDIHYMVKFVGPPQANGVVDLSIPHEKNLQNLIDALQIQPKNLIQVTLDPSKKGREINLPFVEAAKKIGVTTQLIQAGDCVPGMLAASLSSNDRYMIVVGRGGYEEGIKTAAAVKALGGFMQAYEYQRSNTTQPSHQVLSINDLVPASKEQIVVSVSCITNDPWFNQPGIIQHSTSLFTISTILITHTGVELLNKDIRPYSC